MKKILLALLGFVHFAVAEKAVAQTFTVPKDTVEGTYHSEQLTLYSNITNISANPIKIKWKVLDTNFPSGWSSNRDALGICDNVLCRQNDNQIFTNGSQSPFITADIPPANTEDQGMFYIVLVGIDGAESGTYYMTVRLEDEANAYKKDVTFKVNKWATGVSSGSRMDKNITIYPNPARSTINLSFNPTAGIKSVALYNLIGKNVTSYRVNGNAGKMSLDISSIPAGIYYMRLLNAEGEVVATRRFTKQ